VIVYSGVYDEQVIFKNYVDIDLGDATVTYTGNTAFAKIMTDNGQIFNYADLTDVNVFVTGNGSVISPDTATQVQYPIVLSGKGNYIMSFNNVISTTGETIVTAPAQQGISMRVRANKILSKNISDSALINTIQLFINSSLTYNGYYEFIGANIELKKSTSDDNTRSTILVSSTAPQASTVYLDLILTNCVVIGNSKSTNANPRSVISMYGDNGTETGGGNANITLKNTIIYNGQTSPTDAIGLDSLNGRCNLYTYVGSGNTAVNVSVTQSVGTFLTNSNVKPI
jgi:hypothetical protein